MVDPAIRRATRLVCPARVLGVSQADGAGLLLGGAAVPEGTLHPLAGLLRERLLSDGCQYMPPRHGKSGTAAGLGARKLIIDDLIKKAEEAFNENAFEKQWQWFTDTMLLRTETGYKIIIIMTRWATNDLAGRALGTNRCRIEWFHQSENKIARILTNATWVQDHIYFPANWRGGRNTQKQCSPIKKRARTRMTTRPMPRPALRSA